MLLNTDFQRNALSHFKRCPLSTAKIFHWLSRFSPMYLNSLLAKHICCLSYVMPLVIKNWHPQLQCWRPQLAVFRRSGFRQSQTACSGQRSDVPDGSPSLQDREVSMPLVSPAGTGRWRTAQPLSFPGRLNSKDSTQHYSFAISYINISTHMWSINVSLSCVCQKLCHIWRALRF